jgi:gluconolactonase
MTQTARVVARGLGFVEGPVWCQDGTACLVSMTSGCVFEIAPDGEVSTRAHVGQGANGATESKDGTIYVAQSGGYGFGRKRDLRVTGGVQWIDASKGFGYLTQDLVSPNDLCFGPDGCLYVTDPTRPVARSDSRLWRVDPSSGEAQLLASVDWYANGIGFGLESDALYVARSGEQRIVRLSLQGDRLGPAETVVQMVDGRPDGFAFDVDGNLIIAAVGSAPSTIQTWSSEGELLDVFAPGPGEFYTNIALSQTGSLIITDSAYGQLLAVDAWPTAGLPLHPFRSAEASRVPLADMTSSSGALSTTE